MLCHAPRCLKHLSASLESKALWEEVKLLRKVVRCRWVMSSANNDSVSSSFPIWMLFISFCCMLSMARTSNTVLNRSGESRHPCLVPDLSGKVFSFYPWNMILAVDFSYMAFIMLTYASSTPTLLSVFIINGCYTLSNAFSASIDMILWLLSFLLFMWCITFIDLKILYHPCIPGVNPTWSWCMDFVMYCWMRFANILLRILASMFISDIGLQFSFFVVSLADVRIRMIRAS